MSKGSPARQIAISLALAILFAAGLIAYIFLSIERPEPPKLVAPAASDAPRDSRPDDARRVAVAFVQHLAAARYEDAYLMMASVYRQATPLAAFRAACTASPFLSTAASVSIARTREERAAGDPGRGSLTASGVLMTKVGTVESTFWFVDDRAGVAIVGLTIAGQPVLPLGAVAVPAQDASGSVKK